jgi:hypothetical protein
MVTMIEGTNILFLHRKIQVSHWDYVFTPEIAYIINDRVIPIETTPVNPAEKGSIEFEVSSYVSKIDLTDPAPPLFVCSLFCFLVFEYCEFVCFALVFYSN